MIEDLPASTVFYCRIPKSKFYENLSITPQLRRAFIEQINQIVWINKIAPSTSNLATGEYVEEIQVFVMKINQRELDEKVLQVIDREIPYHILYLLEYDGKVQAWIGYKENGGSKTQAFTVYRYFNTDWMLLAELPLKLEGMTIDAVYENFVWQIAGEKLERLPTRTLKEAVEISKRKALLQKQITLLQAKIRMEKQLNIQMQLNSELKKIKREMENLK